MFKYKFVQLLNLLVLSLRCSTHFLFLSPPSKGDIHAPHFAGGQFYKQIYYYSTDCIKKNGRIWQKTIIQDMIFVQNVCVFGTISKRNDCSFCCFLNHICFCKSRVMLRFVRQGKILFVPLFIFKEIVRKFQQQKG